MNVEARQRDEPGLVQQVLTCDAGAFGLWPLAIRFESCTRTRLIMRAYSTNRVVLLQLSLSRLLNSVPQRQRHRLCNSTAKGTRGTCRQSALSTGAAIQSASGQRDKQVKFNSCYVLQLFAFGSHWRTWRDVVLGLVVSPLGRRIFAAIRRCVADICCIILLLSLAIRLAFVRTLCILSIRVTLVTLCRHFGQ